MFKTLKGKISLIYVGLVMLIALVGFSGFYNLYRLEKAVDSLMTNNYKSINAASRMMEAIERQDGAVLISISADGQKGLDLFMENHTDFVKWYQIEDNNITEQGEKNLVGEIGRQYDQYIKYFSQLQSIRDAKGIESAASFYDQSIFPLFNKIKQNLGEISSLNELAMFEAKQDATSKTKVSMYFLLGISFTAVMGGFAVSRYFVNLLLSPLNQLSESISRVKAGELNQQLDIRTNDETGKLAKEFNNMTLRLQNYERSTFGQLMTEKNKSLAIVKSISDPLLVLDADYRTVLVNKACENFFNLVEDKIVGRHFLEAIHNGDIFDHITATVQSESEHKEKIFQLKDSYFNVVVVAVKDVEKNNTSLIVLFQNVTELKELERIKTDFVATISHEFKTPLTSIMMAASMLADPSMGVLSTEQRELTETLNEDGEKLNDLVNDLLELSRIESGNAIYHFDNHSIKNIIDTSIRGFTDIASRRGISLITDLPQELPAVYVDFDKISWVINNLVGNALKYTRSGDRITVSARTDDRNLSISVQDTGPGILPEFIGHVFDKFYQVKGSDIEARGTGLGLYIAREIVNAHKGEIRVSSKPDAGSIFTFTLPVERMGK